MAAAGPANNQVAFLQQYAANPNVAAPTRPLTPEEQAAAAQAGQTQGAAHQGPVEGGSKPGRRENAVPEPPSLGPGVDVPVSNIRGATARIPGIAVRLPTPGSLVFPLLVIVLFWILIIKVNGQSRIGWLWEVLTGNAVVTPTASTQGNFQGATNPPGTDNSGVGSIVGLGNSPLVPVPTVQPPDVTNISNGSTWQVINPTPWLTPNGSGSIAATSEF